MRLNGWAVLAIAVGLLLIACAGSLVLGASSVSAGEALRALTGAEVTEKALRIVRYVRLPRLLAAVLAGTSLSLAGLLLQETLMNPLASPGVIGVNAGAGLCALVVMAFFPSGARAVPFAAFFGALAASLAVYFLARRTGASKSSIVLAGVAISSLLAAGMDAIVSVLPDAAGSRSAFAIGGFGRVTMDQLGFALPLCLAGIFAALFFRRELSILSLGDEVARGLGVRVGAYRLVFLTAAALLAGGAVSFSGLLGFVGLIVPHAARALTKGQEESLMPVSLVLGALFCVVCDLAARTIFAPYELPVGVVLSFIGAPFFLSLLLRRKRSNRHDEA
jgi:iron complex transport system permease protein